jgi:hypothetical protein
VKCTLCVERVRERITRGREGINDVFVFGYSSERMKRAAELNVFVISESSRSFRSFGGENRDQKI